MKKDTKESKQVRIIPLGGLEKVGMNITAFEYDDTIIIVDCGISFPDDSMLGIDLVIPDFSYLIENKEKVKGIFITHGHEDHIGAIPYLLKNFIVPIYATKLTHGLIELKLKEHKLLKKARRKTVKHGQTINLGDFRVEFIKTNHSIADASALAITSKAGVIIHTGDFKIDYTPLFGDAIDLQRLSILGKKGVLALMSDSTNAQREGFTLSERMVAKTFDTLFMDNHSTRMIIATFASNVDRVRQIIDTAHKFGRKVVIQGRSMVNVISVASELGYIVIPDHTLIDVKEMGNYPDDKLVIITTGSQGETMAGLSRMADGSHRTVKIKAGDKIVFSSTPIPGNEKAVSKIINELTQKGADIIYQDTHVSGHACQEELKLMYSLLKPQYVIPVHGEYKHLMAQKKLAMQMGISEKNIFVLSSGDVLELSPEAGAVTGKVKCGEVLVDGLGVGDVGNLVLRDRQNLSTDGLLMINIVLDKKSGRVLAGPDIVSRGFVYIKESEILMKELKSIAKKQLDKCVQQNIRSWATIKEMVKDSISEYIWKNMKRTPVILPVILEI